MAETKKISVLNTATPYMLSRSGSVLDCSPIHPYFMDIRGDNLRELNRLFDSPMYGRNYMDDLDLSVNASPYVRNQLQAPKTLAENLAHLRNWQEQFSGDSFVYDYHLMWAHVADPGYEFCSRNLFEDMKNLII